MTRVIRSSLLSIAALTGVGQSADAGQPTDVVQSDSLENTAMGSDALLHLYTGFSDTAAGYSALMSLSTGQDNTAFGQDALYSVVGGQYNTAVGMSALFMNTGNSNSALGTSALQENADGSDNTAVGSGTLSGIVSGVGNTALGLGAGSAKDGSYTTAVGTNALSNGAAGNTAVGNLVLVEASGENNTGVGSYALNADGTGVSNTAIGALALEENDSGANNTAFGYQALYLNSSGKGNAAQGVDALRNNTTGIRNLAIGSNALYNSNGSYNIALGFDAGQNVQNGSYNIEIGAAGSANDNDTIQIGVQGTQTQTQIAGIFGTPVTGSAVYVTSTGQLGVQGSSERFKTDIAPMADVSEKLLQLRPVTFRYRTDEKGTLQYGLIAEEVAMVQPELVIRDASEGFVGVHYEELAPMLLRQIQRQERVNAEQAEELRAQAAEIRDLEQQVEARAAARKAATLALRRMVLQLQADITRRNALGLVAKR